MKHVRVRKHVQSLEWTVKFCNSLRRAPPKRAKLHTDQMGRSSLYGHCREGSVTPKILEKGKAINTDELLLLTEALENLLKKEYGESEEKWSEEVKKILKTFQEKGELSQKWKELMVQEMHYCEGPFKDSSGFFDIVFPNFIKISGELTGVLIQPLAHPPGVLDPLLLHLFRGEGTRP